MTKFNSDVDIDFADRNEILGLIDTVPATIVKNDKITKHNTGIYPTDIPVNPFTGTASLDYVQAEQRGYVKLDFLNVNLYKQVKNEQHLIELMKEPNWQMLYDPEICSQLIHVNGHYDTLLKMPDPVDSIPRLAMFLAIIRPGKRHLVGQPWREVAKTIWDKVDGEYSFKKSHSVAYSQLVVVNMNLIAEQKGQ